MVSPDHTVDTVGQYPVPYDPSLLQRILCNTPKAYHTLSLLAETMLDEEHGVLDSAPLAQLAWALCMKNGTGPAGPGRRQLSGAYLALLLFARLYSSPSPAGRGFNGG